MTVRAPIIGTDTDSAETFRLALGGIWTPASALNARTGVTSVPVLTGTGNFTATVGPFTCVIDGTSNSLQGSYPVANDIATTITIGAANTQARIDLISLQIQDNAYDSSGFSRGQLIVTAGTPSGSPVAPSAPANSISLWTVPVAANATSITWASATAVFPYAAAAGGIVPARNSSDQPAAANGVQYRHRLDVTAVAGAVSPLESSTNGTTWTPVFDPSGFQWASAGWVWQSANSPQPSLGNGTLTGRYIKIGRLMVCTLALTAGSTTTFGTNAWNFILPLNASNTGQMAGVAYALIGSSAFYGTVYILNAFQVQVVFGTAGTPASSTSPATWGTGSQLNCTFAYESTT